MLALFDVYQIFCEIYLRRRETSVLNNKGQFDIGLIALAVGNDVVTASSLNDALVTLHEVGGDVLGCVLNDVYPEFSFAGINGFDEGGYYYGKKYDKYGKYGRYSHYGKYDTERISEKDKA